MKKNAIAVSILSFGSISISLAAPLHTGTQSSELVAGAAISNQAGCSTDLITAQDMEGFRLIFSGSSVSADSDGVKRLECLGKCEDDYDNARYQAEREETQEILSCYDSFERIIEYRCPRRAKERPNEWYQRCGGLPRFSPAYAVLQDCISDAETKFQGKLAEITTKYNACVSGCMRSTNPLAPTDDQTWEISQILRNVNHSAERVDQFLNQIKTPSPACKD
jgi:hypothetical protein